MMPAAFFDLDGTLLPEPSLERRLMRSLYWRGQWSPWKLAKWMARYLQVCSLPQGMSRERRWVLATHGNKTYWKNVRVASAREFAARAPRIEFFAEGLTRMRWHASRQHRIFLVSGTLEVLAECAADVLREALRHAALPDTVMVCATALGERAGRWTGEVCGEAMWGAAKARAIERLARKHGIDLAHSFAYANSASDRAMLARVGHPMAVNPSRDLRGIAEAAEWPVDLWKEYRFVRKEKAIEHKTDRANTALQSASSDSSQELSGRRG